MTNRTVNKANLLNPINEAISQGEIDTLINVALLQSLSSRYAKLTISLLRSVW